MYKSSSRYIQHVRERSDLTEASSNPRSTAGTDRQRDFARVGTAFAEGRPIWARVQRSTRYGLEVTIGEVKGLVHVRRLPDGTTPADFHPGREVQVRVLRLGSEGVRVALTMQDVPQGPSRTRRSSG